jgi:UTP--glucose-1-phosphate uridylyltransferase
VRPRLHRRRPVRDPAAGRPGAEAYYETGVNIVAVTEVPREQTNRYGILKIGKDDGRLVEVTGLVEKPEPKDAPSNLSIIGRYILLPEVIKYLARMERGAGNEVQLTDGMAALIGEQPFHGLRYEGRRFDCGDKIGFLEAQIAFALKRPDMAAQVRAFLKNYV